MKSPQSFSAAVLIGWFAVFIWLFVQYGMVS